MSPVPTFDRPAASLIVPSRNRPQLLVETVRSVLDGDEVPDDLLVIDQSDAPNAEMEALAEADARVRYSWTPEPGVSRARNRGARDARHDLLVFIDDDVRVTPTWYGEIIRALADVGERAAVTGRVLPDPDAEPGGFVPSTIEDLEPETYHGRIGTDILYSNNMALWRHALDEVGPFDERLGGGATFRTAEDNELAFRLLEAGYTIHYVPGPTVYHRAWRSKRDYHPLCWSYGYGQGAYYAKHLRRHDRHMLDRFRHDLGQRLRRTMQFARRQPHRAVGQVVYMAGMVSGGLRWLLSEARRS